MNPTTSIALLASVEVLNKVTICPCCGSKSESDFGHGCKACGARSVGEPLPRPDQLLPAYGRSLLLAVTGSLMVLVFAIQTFLALTQRSSRGASSTLAFFSMIPFDFWSWVSAAETAAWQLKFVMIPVSIFALWGGRKIYRSITAAPANFCGVRYARNGYMASAAVPLLILILIGVTVPERLRQRERGIEAGINAVGYTFDRAIFEYSLKYQRVPNDLNDLRLLPDANGSIAAALRTLDPVTYPNAYRPYAELAAKQKPHTLRGAVIRNASLSSAPDEQLAGEVLSFTGYELRLPGADKLMGTDDDLMVRDGIISKASDSTKRLGSAAASSEAAKR